MSLEAAKVADNGARYGDDLIRKGTWALVALIVVGEVAALSLGLWRNFAFRGPFTIAIIIVAASLYSFSRTPVEKRPQKLRSIAIALVLTAMVALFYAATIVRLGGNVLKRAI